MVMNTPTPTVTTPVSKAFIESMPGVTAPFGVFDPLDLMPETVEELMLFREAEVVHGRVAMMGALGYIVQVCLCMRQQDKSGMSRGHPDIS